jgi:hypothetical protein
MYTPAPGGRNAATAATLERDASFFSRAAEYSSVATLQTRTGRDVEHFANVLLKQTFDNPPDASEQAHARPKLSARIDRTRFRVRLAVRIVEALFGLARGTEWRWPQVLGLYSINAQVKRGTLKDRQASTWRFVGREEVTP